VLAGGFLQRPKLPAVPGMDAFGGRIFHTSRWDYAYTGGAPGPDGGGLPLLADKRVAVVGTGATALQCVPPLADAAASLHVFQRTPTAVFPRDNEPTDPEWAAGLRPGWQSERTAVFTEITSGVPHETDPVGDKWTQDFAPVAVAHGRGLFGGPAEQEEAELVDVTTMRRVHERVDRIVESAETAQALKPQYRMMCKRPSFHDLYLQTFNEPNVTLVDTAGRGVEKITARGLVANGVEYEVDCIVLATGFDTRPMLRQLALDPVGREARPLSAHWDPEIRTQYGILAHGFPNLFLVGLTQTAAGINYGHTLREQADHVGYLVRETRARGANVVEATHEGEEAWLQTFHAADIPALRDFWLACTPGFYNNEGGVDDVQRFGSGNFGAGPVVFFDLLRRWREAGDMAGVTLS
jgi:cation diffusion facilitator CzcD-associated flavoprotein CzcO